MIRSRNPWLAGLGLAVALAGASPAMAQTSGNDAVTRAPSFDWTADRRQFGTGDIITVLIDERTLASANQSSTATRNSSRRSNVTAGYGPSVIGSRAGAGGEFNSGNRGESSERGQTTRQDRLTTEITARVVAIDPNGVLHIEGTRRLVIDQHEQEVTLTGMIRPNDIAPGNIVESWRVADAQISYASNGKLGRPSGGILGRIIGWIWP